MSFVNFLRYGPSHSSFAMFHADVALQKLQINSLDNGQGAQGEVSTYTLNQGDTFEVSASDQTKLVVNCNTLEAARKVWEEFNTKATFLRNVSGFLSLVSLGSLYWRNGWHTPFNLIMGVATGALAGAAVWAHHRKSELQPFSMLVVAAISSILFRNHKKLLMISLVIESGVFMLLLGNAKTDQEIRRQRSVDHLLKSLTNGLMREWRYKACSIYNMVHFTPAECYKQVRERIKTATKVYDGEETLYSWTNNVVTQPIKNIFQNGVYTSLRENAEKIWNFSAFSGWKHYEAHNGEISLLQTTAHQFLWGRGSTKNGIYFDKPGGSNMLNIHGVSRAWIYRQDLDDLDEDMGKIVKVAIDLLTNKKHASGSHVEELS